MSALKAIGLHIGALGALLITSSAAQAALQLYAPSQWVVGKPVAFEVRADQDTLLNTYEFVTEYGALAGILDLVNNPLETVPEILGSADTCNTFDAGGSPGHACSFTYPSVRPMVPKDTVLTRWEFVVREDAPRGPVLFPIDFGGGVSNKFPLNNYDVLDPLVFTIATDTGAFGGNELVNWPEVNAGGDKLFEVLAIPESSTWLLMLAGLAAVGARAYRVRMAA
jgi:hypothetical protein